MVELRMNRKVYYGLLLALGVGLAVGLGLLMAQAFRGQPAAAPVAQPGVTDPNAVGQLAAPSPGAIQIDPNNPQAAVDAITGQQNAAGAPQPTAAIDYAKYGLGPTGELTPEQDAAVVRVELEESASKVNQPATLFVDTRSSVEFGTGHIPGAVNVQAYVEDNKLETLPKDKEIILYCA